MSLLYKLKSKSVINRKYEEDLYAVVASEMAEGILNSALWLKAYEVAEGNSEKQVSEYIKLSVQSLKDDIHIINSTPVVESPKIEKRHWKDIDNIEDLVIMIEDGASRSDILKSLSDASEEEIKKLINQLDACEQYPLHVAVKNNRADIVEWLLKAGAEYSCVNYWGKTPAEIATHLEHFEILNIIKSHTTK